mgnify:CR=1 FL=1
MQVNSISDVIIAIALAAIPIIGGWIGKVITGNSKATTLISVLSVSYTHLTLPTIYSV